MLGCKMRNWWILKYSCPKHNLKINPQEVVVPQVVIEEQINELEMVEINLQDNDPDQENTRPMDSNIPNLPKENTFENVQGETNEDGLHEVQALVRTNKNGKF